MRLAALRLEHLRCFEAAEFEPGPRGNLLLGGNGSGKTTVLEAAFLLSYGRSFRGGAREALLQVGQSAWRIGARVSNPEGRGARLGLERGSEGWRARVDERPLARLSDLFRHCAVCCFEPGSHELIGGSAEGRRGFVDWGLFHVEPDFLDAWRRYQRALRQRNAGLRQGASDAELEPWEQALAIHAPPISASRARYLEALAPHFRATLAVFFPEAGEAGFEFEPGHRSELTEGLLSELIATRTRDRLRGATQVGPHRADWRPRLARFTRVSELSRGQEKLVALAAVLAQAALHRQRIGHWPIVLLDDLASELDHEHQLWVLDYLGRQDLQALVTGTEASPALAAWAAGARVFHVKHGRITTA